MSKSIDDPDYLLLLTKLRDLHQKDRGAFEQAVELVYQHTPSLAEEVLSDLTAKIEDSWLRRFASVMLVRVKPDKFDEIFDLFISDSDEELRYHACGLAHQYREGKHKERLLKIILTDPSLEVRVVAITASGRIADESIRKKLHALKPMASELKLDDWIVNELEKVCEHLDG